MTKEQATTAIPEDLYNLTQLAEVTLAAGRLSTTNVTEIKDYIYNHKIVTGDHNRKVESHNLPLRNTTDSNNIWSQIEFHTAKPQCDNNLQKNINNTTTATTTTTITSFYSSSDDDSNYYSHKIFDRKKLRRSTISDNSRFDEHSSCSSSIPCSSSSSRSSSSDEQYIANISIGEEHIDSDSAKINTSDSGSSVCGLLEDEHICIECGKKYSTSSNLARHRQTHRSIMDKKARRCPYCEKVYVSMPAFSMHVRTHNQGCECQYCGKCFSRPWLLQGHIRTHTGEKPFKCSVCSKAFADKSNLRAHIQTHSNTKPHCCARCGKAFALKSYLYKHEESSCMKNHPRTEKDIRNSATRCATTTMQISKGNPNQQPTTTICNDSSAKTTLATKLLQKRANPINTTLIGTNTYSYNNKSFNFEHLNNTNSSPRHSDVITLAKNVDVGQYPENAPYITSVKATVPPPQDNYECFKRISVIHHPPAQAAAAAATPPPQTGIVYAEMLPVSKMPPMHFYTSSNNAASTIDSQDTPVDFSPKNNFSHSSKTSPFELTGNYGMVA